MTYVSITKVISINIKQRMIRVVFFFCFYKGLFKIEMCLGDKLNNFEKIT